MAYFLNISVEDIQALGRRASSVFSLPYPVWCPAIRVCSIHKRLAAVVWQRDFFRFFRLFGGFWLFPTGGVPLKYTVKGRQASDLRSGAPRWSLRPHQTASLDSGSLYWISCDIIMLLIIKAKGSVSIRWISPRRLNVGIITLSPGEKGEIYRLIRSPGLIREVWIMPFWLTISLKRRISVQVC